MCKQGERGATSEERKKEFRRQKEISKWNEGSLVSDWMASLRGNVCQGAQRLYNRALSATPSATPCTHE